MKNLTVIMKDLTSLIDESVPQKKKLEAFIRITSAINDLEDARQGENVEKIAAREQMAQLTRVSIAEKG